MCFAEFLFSKKVAAKIKLAAVRERIAPKRLGETLPKLLRTKPRGTLASSKMFASFPSLVSELLFKVWRGNTQHQEN